MRRKILVFLIILCIALPFPAWGDEPMDMLKQTIDKIVQVLNSPGMKSPEKKDELAKEIKNIVDSVFDYEELASRTVGLHWKDFSPEQKKEFIAAFTELLDANYLDSAAAYSGGQVTFTGERRSKAGNVEITTTVIFGKDQIAMAYRLKKKDTWKVYDIIVAGVSLVKNYRAQFQQMMANGSPADLITAVKKKAQEIREGKKGSNSAQMQDTNEEFSCV